MKKKFLMFIMAGIMCFNFVGCASKETEVNSDYDVQEALNKYKDEKEEVKNKHKQKEKSDNDFEYEESDNSDKDNSNILSEDLKYEIEINGDVISLKERIQGIMELQGVGETENTSDSVELNGDLFDCEAFSDIMSNREQPDIKTAYQYIMNSYNKIYDECNYDLIYLDNDDIPELVVESYGGYVSMYTFSEGKIYSLMYKWSFGAGGNHGYEYKEKSGIIFNYNSEYAGLEGYSTYLELSDDHNIEFKYYLKTSYEDENGNVIMVSGQDEIEEDNWKFYYSQNGTEEIPISESEFNSYDIFNSDEYEMIIGRYTEEEVMERLSSLERENIFDSSFLFYEDIEFPEQVELIYETIDTDKNGDLYLIRIDMDYEFDGRYYYGYDRTKLGYFYVTDSVVYFVDELIADGEMTIDVVKSQGRVIYAEQEYYENLGIIEKENDYLEFVDGNCIYHYYNDLVETGYYRTVGWNKEQGLIMFRNGFGALSESISLYKQGVDIDYGKETKTEKSEVYDEKLADIFESIVGEYDDDVELEHMFIVEKTDEDGASYSIRTRNIYPIYDTDVYEYNEKELHFLQIDDEWGFERSYVLYMYDDHMELYDEDYETGEDGELYGAATFSTKR